MLTYADVYRCILESTLVDLECGPGAAFFLTGAAFFSKKKTGVTGQALLESTLVDLECVC
jgi:hypothetical protein